MKARSTNALGGTHFAGDVTSGVDDGVGVKLGTAQSGATVWIEPLTDDTDASIGIRAKGSGVVTIVETGIYNVLDYGATGDYATDDTQGIQDAIDACPAYGVVYIPKGNYLISSTLTITRPLTLRGEGFGSILYVLPAIGNTNDVLSVTPATEGTYFRFQDFCVASRLTTAGRHAIALNATAVSIKDSVFSGLLLYATNGKSIYATGSGTGDGSLVISSIDRCILASGLELNSCGDAVVVTRNHILGAGKGVDVDFVSGASTFVFKSNVVTSAEGMLLGAYTTAAQIVENELETLAGFTGSNGAVLDIDGDASNPANNVIVARNSFQVVNSITADCVRVNYANQTQLYGNRFGRGATTSKDIVVTANANDTMVGNNAFVSGLPLTTMLSDSGTRTSFLGAIPGYQMATKPLIVAAVASGADGEQIRFNRSAGDAARFNSIFSKSASGAASTVSVYVHDGVTDTSQKGCMMWTGEGFTYLLTMPPAHANNAAAIAAGRTTGEIYRTGGDPDVLCVVHAP